MKYEATGSTSNLLQLQNYFGKRPGGYLVDPHWFRRNKFTGKPDLWNPETKTWQQVGVNDQFEWDDEGNVVKV